MPDQATAASLIATQAKLSIADAAEARNLLGRFLTPNLAAAAARHTDASIRELALRYLKEPADEGDPFAADLLRSLPNADDQSISRKSVATKKHENLKKRTVFPGES